MATQQFGYGPNVWAPAKGTGVVDIPKLLQPGAVTPDFKPENPSKALAAKAIGEMAYAHFMGGKGEEEESSEKPNWLSTDEHYKQTAGQIFKPSIAELEEMQKPDYDIVYKEHKSGGRGKGGITKVPIDIVGEYPWDTDPEGFLTRRNLHKPFLHGGYPEIFNLLPVNPDDDNGRWIWSPFQDKWVYKTGPTPRQRP